VRSVRTVRRPEPTSAPGVSADRPAPIPPRPGFARAMPEFPAAFAHSLAASVEPHPDRFFGELPPLEDDASR